MVGDDLKSANNYASQQVRVHGDPSRLQKTIRPTVGVSPHFKALTSNHLG